MSAISSREIKTFSLPFSGTFGCYPNRNLSEETSLSNSVYLTFTTPKPSSIPNSQSRCWFERSPNQIICWAHTIWVCTQKSREEKDFNSLKEESKPFSPSRVRLDMTQITIYQKKPNSVKYSFSPFNKPTAVPIPILILGITQIKSISIWFGSSSKWVFRRWIPIAKVLSFQRLK